MKKEGEPIPAEVIVANYALHLGGIPLVEKYRPERTSRIKETEPVFLPPFNEEIYSLPRLPENWPPFAILETKTGILQTHFLGLSTRAKNALARAEKTNLAELISLPEDDLREIRLVGVVVAEEIRYRLELLRLRLKGKQGEMPGNLMILVFAEGGFSVTPGPLLSEIKLPEPIDKEITEEETVPFVPPFQFEFPQEKENFSELDGLISLGFLPNKRTTNALKRGDIKTISQLRQISSGEISVRSVGKVAEEEISQALERFYQLVNQKQNQDPSRVPVVIEFPPLEQRPLEQRRDAQAEKQWLRNNSKIIAFIAKWQKNHPGKKGALSATAEEFQLTRARIGQIVNKFRKITNRPDALRPKQLKLPIEEVVNFIKGWQEENPGVKGARMAAARELDIPYYLVLKCIRLHEEETGESLKKQELTPEERKRIKEEELLSKPTEEVMNYLMCRASGRQHLYPRVFAPLSVIARQAGITNLREISRVFEALEMSKGETGFVIRRIERRVKGRKTCYYFLHPSQKEAILTWLSQNYTPESRNQIINIDTGEPVPITTTEFRKVFIPTLNVIRETTALKFHARSLVPLLKHLTQEGLLTINLYRYRRTVNIHENDLSAFKSQISEAREEIASFITSSTPSRVQS